MIVDSNDKADVEMMEEGEISHTPYVNHIVCVSAKRNNNGGGYLMELSGLKNLLKNNSFHILDDEEPKNSFITCQSHQLEKAKSQW